MCALVRGMTDILTPVNLCLNSEFFRTWSNDISEISIPSGSTSVKPLVPTWTLQSTNCSLTVTRSISNKRLRITGTITSVSSGQKYLRVYNSQIIPGEVFTQSIKMNVVSDSKNIIGNIIYNYDNFSRSYLRSDKTGMLVVGFTSDTNTNIYGSWSIYLSDNISVGDTFTIELYEPMIAQGSFIDLPYRTSMDTRSMYNNSDYMISYSSKETYLKNPYSVVFKTRHDAKTYGINTWVRLATIFKVNANPRGCYHCKLLIGSGSNRYSMTFVDSLLYCSTTTPSACNTVTWNVQYTGASKLISKLRWAMDSTG